MIFYKCDKCKCEIRYSEKEQLVIKNKLPDLKTVIVDTRVDLCSDCFDDLHVWAGLKGRKK